MLSQLNGLEAKLRSSHRRILEINLKFQQIISAESQEFVNVLLMFLRVDQYNTPKSDCIKKKTLPFHRQGCKFWLLRPSVSVGSRKCPPGTRSRQNSGTTREFHDR